MLATAFLSGKSWGTPAEQAPGRRGRSGFTAAPGPLAPRRLCDVSALLVAGWGEAKAEHVCGTPKGWEAGQPPHSPLPEERPPFGGSAVQRRAGLAWAWTLWAQDAGLPATGASAPPKERTADLYGGQRMGSPTSPPPSSWEFHLCIRKNWGWGRKEFVFFFLMYFEMTRILSLLKCQTCKTVFRKRTCLKESEGVSYHLGFGRSLY